MRKILFALSLAGLAVLVSTDDAFASGRGSGGGRGGGGGGRGGSSMGRGNVGRGYGGGGYYGGGYGGGIYLGGLGYYGGGGGYSPYYQNYGYAPSYYDGTAGYSNYSNPAPLLPTTQVRQSFYPAPAPDVVNVTVLVPAANAQVWFDNNATSQQGMQRMFESPSLTPNHSYTYTIKARWMENGNAVNQERQVNVQAGQNVTVNFRENPREIAPQPMPATILQK